MLANCVQFSDDGELVVSASKDNTVREREKERKRGRERARERGRDEQVISARDDNAIRGSNQRIIIFRGSWDVKGLGRVFRCCKPLFRIAEVVTLRVSAEFRSGV